jgi:hypothetical protein
MAAVHLKGMTLVLLRAPMMAAILSDVRFATARIGSSFKWGVALDGSGLTMPWGEVEPVAADKAIEASRVTGSPKLATAILSHAVGGRSLPSLVATW